MSKKLKTKTLILIRHAHRNKPFGSEGDNGLSARGRKQAKAVIACFKAICGKTRPVIYSSPKVRCVETVTPLARAKKERILILDALNEAITEPLLQQKVLALELFWKNESNPLVIFCSHGDVIPALLKHLTGMEIDLDKAGWAQLELEDQHLRLRWLVQNPELLAGKRK